MNNDQFLEDIAIALHNGDISVEDITEAYNNHELSNYDIEAIEEISADLAKHVYDRRSKQSGYYNKLFDRAHDNLHEYNPEITKQPVFHTLHKAFTDPVFHHQVKHLVDANDKAVKAEDKKDAAKKHLLHRLNPLQKLKFKVKELCKE